MLKKAGSQLQHPPDLPEMHQLLGQALEKRGQRLHLSWKVNIAVQFTLEVICPVKGGDPQWSLHTDRKVNRELVFQYTSTDVLLVYNAIMQAAADSQQSKSAADHEAPQESAIRSFMAANENRVEQARATSPPPTSSQTVVKPNIPDSGDLAKHSIADLLKTITQGRLTGKLEVTNNQLTALVYIQDGLPIDATAGDLVGDDAMIEFLTWREGQFTFETRVLRNSHTVHQTIESLLAQSKQLSDHMKFLKEGGMRSTSILLLKNPEMTRGELLHKISTGVSVDVDALLNFYGALDGRKTVEELTRSLQISRVKIVHLIYELVVRGLVKISNEGPPPKPLTVQPRPIDTAAIQTVMMSLRRADTGMFMYPAFLYFLEQEYFRTYRSKGVFSILVFEMREQVEGRGRPLPTQAVVDAVLRISQLKRHVDLLAHYDGFDYAMLLPNTKSGGARVFANRLVKILTDSPLGGIAPGRLSLAFGSASVPEDFVDLSSLLGAADLAMNSARESKQTVVLYRDLKTQAVEVG